jgi:citrate lyase subunit beta/citryl-CoA lyase
VPGSSPRFLAKARGLAVDEVFLDLEDAVAPAQKASARTAVAAALREGGWGGKVAAVRVNDVTTGWAHHDVIDVVEQAGDRLDVIVLPKVTSPEHVSWLDLLLGQVETAMGYPAGRIGIEAQIEDAAGLARVDQIAAASPRLEALVFGPADFMASLGMRSLEIGAQPAGYAGGDAFHYAHLRILVAARSCGLQAIDGPYAAISDPEGLRRSAASVAALGYDGKWVLHPGQVDIVNAEFSPAQADYDQAELLLEAYGGPGAGGRPAPHHVLPATRGRGPARVADYPRDIAPQEVRALSRPGVSSPAASSSQARASVTQRASAASSPAASVPPVISAA